MNLSNQAFKGGKIELQCTMPNFRETQKMKNRTSMAQKYYMNLYLRTYVTNYNQPQFFPIEILSEFMKQPWFLYEKYIYRSYENSETIGVK
jgi:hypothetical protein